MKKTLVTILAAVAAVASSYGQGTVTYINTATTLVQMQTSQLNPSLIAVPITTTSGASVQLLWAPVGTTDLNLFTAAITVPTVKTTADGITTFTTSPGRFSAGVTTVGTAVAGGPVALVLRGWTGGAASYALAQPGYAAGTAAIGYSSIFTMAVTGNPTTTPAGASVGITPAFTGMTLSFVAVPEPTSMVLAGLGAASLLMFRRKK